MTTEAVSFSESAPQVSLPVKPEQLRLLSQKGELDLQACALSLSLRLKDLGERTLTTEEQERQEAEYLKGRLVNKKGKVDLKDPDKLWVALNILYPEKEATVAYTIVRPAQIVALGGTVPEGWGSERIHRELCKNPDTLDLLNQRQIFVGEGAALKLLGNAMGIEEETQTIGEVEVAQAAAVLQPQSRGGNRLLEVRQWFRKLHPARESAKQAEKPPQPYEKQSEYIAGRFRFHKLNNKLHFRDGKCDYEWKNPEFTEQEYREMDELGKRLGATEDKYSGVIFRTPLKYKPWEEKFEERKKIYDRQPQTFVAQSWEGLAAVLKGQTEGWVGEDGSLHRLNVVDLEISQAIETSDSNNAPKIADLGNKIDELSEQKKITGSQWLKIYEAASAVTPAAEDTRQAEPDLMSRQISEGSSDEDREVADQPAGVESVAVVGSTEMGSEVQRKVLSPVEQTLMVTRFNQEYLKILKEALGTGRTIDIREDSDLFKRLTEIRSLLDDTNWEQVKSSLVNYSRFNVHAIEGSTLLEVFAKIEKEYQATEAGEEQPAETIAQPGERDAVGSIPVETEGLKPMQGELISIWQDPGRTPVEHIVTIEYDRNRGERITGENFTGFVLPSNEDENTACEDRAGFVELADGTKVFLGADGVGQSYNGGIAAQEIITAMTGYLQRGYLTVDMAAAEPERVAVNLGKGLQAQQQKVLDDFEKNSARYLDQGGVVREVMAEKALKGSETTFYMIAISPSGQVRYFSVGDGVIEKIGVDGEITDELPVERGVRPGGGFSTIHGFIGRYQTGTIELKNGETFLFGTDGMKHNLKALQEAFKNGARPGRIDQVKDDLTVFAYYQEENSPETAERKAGEDIVPFAERIIADQHPEEPADGMARIRIRDAWLGLGHTNDELATLLAKERRGDAFRLMAQEVRNAAKGNIDPIVS